MERVKSSVQRTTNITSTKEVNQALLFIYKKIFQNYVKPIEIKKKVVYSKSRGRIM
jgi:hypothetical protein